MSKTTTNTTPETQSATTPKATAPEIAEAAKPVEGSNEWLQEKVPVELFKDGEKYIDDVVVCVNGNNFLIKRGEKVMVPRYIAIQLEICAKQKKHAEYIRDDGWKNMRISQEGKED